MDVRIPSYRIELFGLLLLCVTIHVTGGYTYESDPTARRRDPTDRYTHKGRVRGTSFNFNGKTVDAFLGIPFAKPPVGNLRFKHPQPNDRWEGTLDATKLPPTCVQAPDLSFGNFSGATMWNPNTVTQEDCLYLNVWVPRTTPRLKRSAVLVWIFGGGFTTGSATLDVYDGRVIAAEREVIVVSMQYRLGFLGYMALGIPDAPGNAGMFDQLMALQWVKNNINYFGGDSNNVTLFGESAGSVSVSMHLLSPLSRDKFARAIMQSGVAIGDWATTTMEEAKRRTIQLSKLVNCTRNSWNSLVECLHKIPPMEFPEHEYSIVRGIMQWPFVPVIDGTFFIEPPTLSLERGNFKKCPILLGSNSDEATYFMLYDLPDYFNRENEDAYMTRDKFINSMERFFFYYPQYPKEMNRFGFDALMFQYTPWKNVHDGIKSRDNIDDAVGDYHFVCKVNKWAEAYAKFNLPVYYYYFTHRSSMNPWPRWTGVMHADEIPYVFGEPLNMNLKYTPKERELSRKMMSYWVNFGKTGDPNNSPRYGLLNEWPIHSLRGREYLTLNTDTLDSPDKSKNIGHGPRSRACAFWNDYLPNLHAATEPISLAERRWKLQFNEWSTRYIVEWKRQYDNFINDQLKFCRHNFPVLDIERSSADDFIDNTTEGT
ncbi:acetylcholinesterase-like [Tubulanus polymorphus]|uniref:acetylcholinesterase-like n=1 Tax=Tubulanus polymorphus TaxID=672921 RepID=UPI003DA624EC